MIFISIVVFAILLCAISSKVPKIVLWLIIMLGLALRVIIATRNPLVLQGFILCEDAHYCFNIARNIALGNGIRHDGFNVTTGFQPLFVFFIVPIFKVINNKLLAINVVMLFQIIIGLIYGFILYKIARLISTKKIAAIIIAIWAFSPVFVKIDVNGLETNTAFCMLCLIVYYYFRKCKYSAKTTNFNYIFLGILLGLGALARLDILFLMPALLLDIIWHNFKKREKKDIFKKIFIAGAFGGLVILPWFIYNLLIGKTILPSSGQAVRFSSQAFGFRFLSKSGKCFNIGEIPFIYYRETIIRALKKIRGLLGNIFPLKAGLLLFVSWFCLDFKGFMREIKKLLFLLLFLLTIFFAYTCYIFGQWFFYRYFTPYAIGYLLLLAIAMKNLTAAKIVRKHRIFFKYFNIIFISLTVSLLFFKSAKMVHDSYFKKDSLGYYKMAEWVNANTEKSAIIGSFQTGILGYYLERKFYGLDGKINQDALNAMKENRIDEYVKEKNINYIMDKPKVLNDLFVKRSRDKDFLKKQQLVLKDYYVVYRINTNEVK